MSIDGTNICRVGGMIFKTSGNISFKTDKEDTLYLAPKSKLNEFEKATYATYEKYFGGRAKPDPTSAVV